MKNGQVCVSAHEQQGVIYQLQAEDSSQACLLPLLALGGIPLPTP